MRRVAEKSGSFEHEDHELAYTVYGEGPRVTVLVHSLLMNRRMQARLARALAAEGNRVVTVDLLGHGASDRPRDMWKYSMPVFGAQVVALLDHLGIEQAVVGGTSLGANATLEVASRAPERLRGMILEMPVLDNALLASALAFTPLLVWLTFGEPVMKAVAWATRLVPSDVVPFGADLWLDTLRQDPGPSGAVLQGLFSGRMAPHRSERRTFTAPSLVIGHRRDPVHPFSDAGMLADELPDARLVEADSIVELRVWPERLTAEISAFVDRVLAAPSRGPAGQRARANRSAAAIGSSGLTPARLPRATTLVPCPVDRSRRSCAARSGSSAKRPRRRPPRTGDACSSSGAGSSASRPSLP
jgi:pimeloyl-ACP methyl ester carboxylesterase